MEHVPTIGNEPHHIGTSFDRKTILGSGLLSFLKLQDDIFQVPSIYLLWVLFWCVHGSMKGLIR